MNTRPNPLMMPSHAPATVTPVAQLAAEVFEFEHGRTVRPGFVLQQVEGQHNGVVKAKQVEAGQTVRAFLHGEPRGGERVVESVTRSADGATVTITFSTQHPTAEYKPAYRFFVAALVGSTVTTSKRVATFVDVR